MIRVTVFPPRCWLFGHRWHHALTGFALILAGLVLILSDLRDRKVWLTDFVRTTN